MTARLGIREVARNLNALQQYDYVELEDKKSHKIKGLFVSEKYSDDVREYLEKRLKSEQKKKRERYRKWVGRGSVDPRFDNLTSREIREKIAREKYGHAHDIS